MDPSLPIFPSCTLRVVCTSNTHNDDPSASVPGGEIFIHAGDMTESSSLEEYATVIKWVSALPHKVKILIAGNRDRTLDAGTHLNAHLGDPKLDRGGNKFSQESFNLLTCPEVRGKGIHYLDRETRTVAYYRTSGGSLTELRVYANPQQPEFSSNRWPFTYSPHPAPEATAAWDTAPSKAEEAQIWVTHCPPLGHLDDSNVPGLIGCRVLAENLEQARPRLCIFGHYHFSWGVERYNWDHGEGELLTLSEERRKMRGLLDAPKTVSVLDFTEDEDNKPLKDREETLLANAAWMTWRKHRVEDRNMPIFITLTLP